MGLMGSGEGNTVLILTQTESAQLRKALDSDVSTLSERELENARLAFNSGIKRGTAKIAEEFAATQKAKRK